MHAKNLVRIFKIMTISKSCKNIFKRDNKTKHTIKLQTEVEKYKIKHIYTSKVSNMQPLNLYRFFRVQRSEKSVDIVPVANVYSLATFILAHINGSISGPAVLKFCLP